MKFLILTTLVGLATAAGSNKYPTSKQYPTTKPVTTTSYSSQSSSASKLPETGSISTFQTSLPTTVSSSSSGLGASSSGSLMGGSSSNIAVTSFGGVNTGNMGLFSPGGLSSIGNSAVLVTSATTGGSSVISGVPNTTGIYPKADLNNYLYATQSTNYDSMASNAIANALSNTVSTSMTRSLDNIFVRLPTSNELDTLILAADSVGIIKTIQTIATEDTLPCQQRISYLLDFLGRIKAAIEKKNLLPTFLT